MTKGYAADLDYTAGFYPETSPARMAFAALAAGRSPGRAARPERILELGFGQGFGLALLAAANPDVRFEGYDFNPAHVAHARGLADAAGLENLEVGAASFEDLAAAPDAEADCDVVLAHGIMSWVSEVTVEAVVTLLRRRLRPGGLFYVSYNCSPGRVPDGPLRELFRAVAARTSGGPLEQVQAAIELIRTLRDGGAAYLAHNPVAAHQAATILTADPHYLAHEYLGEHWRIFSAAEMIQVLRPADLNWLCSATPANDLPNLRAPAPLLPLIASADADPAWRETLKDIACNRGFRRDIYVRGGASAAAPDLNDWVFVLTTPRTEVALSFESPFTARLDGAPAFYLPVVDRLAEGPASLAELQALAPFAGRPELLVECLALLVGSGQVEPAPPAGPIDPSPAHRFNVEVVARAGAGRFYGALASPLTRSGTPVRELDLLVLAALSDGLSAEIDPLSRRIGDLLTSTGRTYLDGVPLQSGAAGFSQLSQAVELVIARRLPLWSRLGLLPAV